VTYACAATATATGLDFADINYFVGILGGATPCWFANADINATRHRFRGHQPVRGLLSAGAGLPVALTVPGTGQALHEIKSERVPNSRACCGDRFSRIGTPSAVATTVRRAARDGPVHTADHARSGRTVSLAEALNSIAETALRSN